MSLHSAEPTKNTRFLTDLLFDIDIVLCFRALFYSNDLLFNAFAEHSYIATDRHVQNNQGC